MTMTDIFVGRLMSSPVESVRPDTPVQAAATTLLDRDIGSVVVVEDGEFRGILTTTDFVQITADGDAAAGATVSEYMTTDVVTVTANASITDVADLMVEHGFHHVPVVDDETGVIGMVTSADLTAYLSHLDSPQLV